jgi:hypothetical protein
VGAEVAGELLRGVYAAGAAESTEVCDERRLGYF